MALEKMHSLKRLKFGNARILSSEIMTGVPGDTLLERCSWGYMINVEIYDIETLSNYADDNVLSSSGNSQNDVAASLEKSSQTALK